MDERIINGKYQVLDTLYTDEFQSIFICGDIKPDKEEKYIIGEFSDRDIIDAIRDSFALSGDDISKSIKETFDIDERFYTVFPMTKSTSLEEHLTKHNLTIADKMFITEELLKKFMNIDRSSYAIQYALCDLNNLSIKSRRYLSFNYLFIFKKENLKVTSQDVLKKFGYLILCIFANSPEADIEKHKDALPPAILSIVKKCNERGYNSIKSIYEDFKKTLLYTTFIDTSSLDTQIRHRMVKAQKKRSTVWMKYVVGVLVLAVLLRGGFWLVKNRSILPGFGKGGIERNGKKNSQPKADFSISISKIYKDDEVIFIDKSTTSEPGGVIKSRLWTIEKDGTVIMNSDYETLQYVFDEAGEYKISLIVQDSKGANSKPYSHNISVLEKPEFPDYADTDNSKDRK